LVSPDLMSAINLSRANGGIASIGKLSIITLARVVEGHCTAATLGPATGRLRIMLATASWKVAEDPEADERAAVTGAPAAGESTAATVTDCITRLLAASAISTVTGPCM